MPVSRSKAVDHGAAPFLLHAAIHDERALRLRRSGDSRDAAGEHAGRSESCRNFIDIPPGIYCLVG